MRNATSPPDLSNPINVSTIDLRSPFRFPGGKTSLVPLIKFWLETVKRVPKVFCEPFLGGGIIGLTVAFENLAENIVLVEIDPDIAAVWQTIFDGDANWLIEKIGRFELRETSARYWRSRKKLSKEQRAFRTILLNRVNRGGILTDDAGMLKSGENGRGISSRWYPDTLQSRIKDIAKIKTKIVFIRGDGLKKIEELKDDRDVCFFIDPPYTAGGNKEGERLYSRFELDHERLFELVSNVKGDFLMTYSDNEKVRDLARKNDMVFREIAMKTTHHNIKNELLIGRNLEWLQS